jgi:hypothetical protein
MAQTFTNAVANNVTTVTTVYTAPAATTSVIVGLIIANDAGADTTVTVSVVKGATTVNVLNSAPLPSASNLSVLSNNNRLVLLTGNSISVTAAAAVDVVASVLELT